MERTLLGGELKGRGRCGRNWWFGGTWRTNYSIEIVWNIFKKKPKKRRWWKICQKFLSRVKIQSFSTKSHITIESLSLFEILGATWAASPGMGSARTPRQNWWQSLTPIYRGTWLDHVRPVLSGSCFHLGPLAFVAAFRPPNLEVPRWAADRATHSPVRFPFLLIFEIVENYIGFLLVR